LVELLRWLHYKESGVEVVGADGPFTVLYGHAVVMASLVNW
jgi:F0F1-type ATP synthase epsilon subunit